MIHPDQRVNHYRLIEKIGEGGMGAVWKAEDTRLQRHVALKFVPESETSDATAVDRHLREARAASALNHPHICAIHDIGEWKGRRFIVMELLEGRSLHESIGGKPMKVDSAVDLTIQISEALGTAHAKGIVHRDLKPANIFVTNDGNAKLLDFGLAKLATPEAPGEGDATRTALERTRPGMVVGTVAYMSPGQALGEDIDHRTDIFSLGVVLYEMITARRAFGGNTSAAVFDAILNRAPTAPVTFNPRVPHELQSVVNRALEKDPSLRYQSAADLAADLRRLRRDTSAGPSGAVPRAERSYSWRWLGIAAGLVAIVALLAVGVLSLRPDPADTTPVAAAPAATGNPTIAVLPFANASEDAEQEYFSIGLTEEIITEISRYRELA